MHGKSFCEIKIWNFFLISADKEHCILGAQYTVLLGAECRQTYKEIYIGIYNAVGIPTGLRLVWTDHYTLGYNTDLQGAMVSVVQLLLESPSKILKLYFDSAYYLGISPYRFATESDGCIRERKWTPQMVHKQSKKSTNSTKVHIQASKMRIF